MSSKGSAAPAPASASESKWSSVVSTVKSWVARVSDRSDPTIKGRQDLALNAALFVGAVLLINKYGYKLAV